MISAAQVAVPNGSAVTLVTMPPGSQVTLTVPGGTIYVGGTGVTAAAGAPVTGVVPIANPVSGSATVLSAIAAAGTVTAGVISATVR